MLMRVACEGRPFFISDGKKENKRADKRADKQRKIHVNARKSTN